MTPQKYPPVLVNLDNNAPDIRLHDGFTSLSADKDTGIVHRIYGLTQERWFLSLYSISSTRRNFFFLITPCLFFLLLHIPLKNYIVGISGKVLTYEKMCRVNRGFNCTIMYDTNLGVKIRGLPPIGVWVNGKHWVMELPCQFMDLADRDIIRLAPSSSKGRQWTSTPFLHKLRSIFWPRKSLPRDNWKGWKDGRVEILPCLNETTEPDNFFIYVFFLTFRNGISGGPILWTGYHSAMATLSEQRGASFSVKDDVSETIGI